MIIKSATKNYTISISENFEFITELINAPNSLIVLDKTLYEIYKAELFSDIPDSKLFIIEALESNKTIEKALEICEIMTNIPAKRNAHLISFGGGIIQDLTGFAANILYRGVKWTFIPTTLLAACDSCIGGKTSLNYKSYKNLLGTFYPPDAIYICSKFFKTLSDKDFKSGLGEVVKFNVMFGKEGICNIEDNIESLLVRDDKTLDRFVENSLLFKKDFIEEDEFDKGVRIHLNFAHTFGHAIETVTKYRIPHGTAVAMGTIIANQISLQRNIMSNATVERINHVLRKIINVDISDISVNIDEIINAIRKDKKQIDSNLTAVLMDENMKLLIVHDVKIEEIEKAFNFIINFLK